LWAFLASASNVFLLFLRYVVPLVTLAFIICLASFSHKRPCIKRAAPALCAHPFPTTTRRSKRPLLLSLPVVKPLVLLHAVGDGGVKVWGCVLCVHCYLSAFGTTPYAMLLHSPSKKSLERARSLWQLSLCCRSAHQWRRI
jgi:hypothetical protein